MRLGLESIAHRNPKYVLVHDIARPLISPVLIKRILTSLKTNSAAVPALAVTDTLKRATNHQIEATVPRDALLTINADLRGELDFFRIGFYLRDNAHLLHNLTFLRDENIHQPDVYIVTRAKDKPFLETLGAVTQLRQSAHTRRETSSADRFTLFHLRFNPDLKRYPLPTYISTVEAMGRQKDAHQKDGPFCGPPP